MKVIALLSLLPALISAASVAPRADDLASAIGASDDSDTAGDLTIPDITLGKKVDLEGAVYVGKDTDGTQLYKFNNGDVASINVGTGDFLDGVTVNKKGLCSICIDSAGSAKRELGSIEEREDLASALDASDNSDVAGVINLGDDLGIGQETGVDGGKFVGHTDDDTQLYQFSDGKVGTLNVAAGDIVPNVTVGADGLCSICVGDSVSKRDLSDNAPEEKRTLIFLAILASILGHRPISDHFGAGHGLHVGHGHVEGSCGRGGYVNIHNAKRGDRCGIRGAKYAGCDRDGNQLWHFKDGHVRPLVFRRGPNRNVKVNWFTKVAYGCKKYTRGKNSWWWKRSVADEVAPRSTILAPSADAAPAVEKRFLLLGLFLSSWFKVGHSFRVGHGNAPGYCAKGGYVNFKNVHLGSRCGIRGGVYVGCNRDGVQLWKFNNGRIGPIRMRKGHKRTGHGYKVKNNKCDVCSRN